MLKKILSLILCLCMCFGIVVATTSCGSDESSSTSTGTTAKVPTTLSFLGITSEETDPENVEIVEQSYSGYKIPSNAIRFNKENNSGVYVLRGKIISFIEVEILYSQEEYVIVSASRTGGRGLKLYDDVVIKGRDVYDGKVIN